jgi:chaperonin GroES
VVVVQLSRRLYRALLPVSVAPLRRGVQSPAIVTPASGNPLTLADAQLLRLVQNGSYDVALSIARTWEALDLVAIKSLTSSFPPCATSRPIAQNRGLSTSTIKRIIPLLDRVLIEKAVAKKTSAGGVLLPESAQSKLNEGKVIAVGPGGRATDGSTIPMAVKSGDSVLLPEYGGSKVTIDGKDLFLYRDDDLLGVLEH